MNADLAPKINGLLSYVEREFYETNDLKDKVRTAVSKKAREIADSVQTGRPIPSMVFTTRIQEYFEKIGLERVYELDADENSFTALIMPGLVLKVDNDTAEKILALGLP